MSVRARLAVVATLAALPLTAPALAAQQIPLDSLKSGEHVRIWASEPRLRGTVSRLHKIGAGSARVTALKAERDSYEGTIALANVGSLEVLRRKRGTGRTAFGAVAGGVTGGVVGLLVGGLLACGGGGCAEFEGLGAALFGAASGIAVGATLGGIKVGRGPAQWQPVALTPK